LRYAANLFYQGLNCLLDDKFSHRSDNCRNPNLIELHYKDKPMNDQKSDYKIVVEALRALTDLLGSDEGSPELRQSIAEVVEALKQEIAKSRAAGTASNQPV
jgi:hypothetical protein